MCRKKAHLLNINYDKENIYNFFSRKTVTNDQIVKMSSTSMCTKETFSVRQKNEWKEKKSKKKRGRKMIEISRTQLIIAAQWTQITILLFRLLYCVNRNTSTNLHLSNKIIFTSVRSLSLRRFWSASFNSFWSMI